MISEYLKGKFEERDKWSAIIDEIEDKLRKEHQDIAIEIIEEVLTAD